MDSKLAVALAAVFGLAMTMDSGVTWSQGRGGVQSGGGGGHLRGSGGHGVHAGGAGHYRGWDGHGGRHSGGSHYGSRYGGHYGGYYGGHYGLGAGIYLGSALYWGWPWYGGYPYYPYYPYGGYLAQEPAPTVYVERAQPAPGNFWYYCTDPAGYFPYVKNCNVPWMQVVPTPPPPAEPGK